MKRSEINHLIKESIDFFERNRWNLPPFADWELPEWIEIIETSELSHQYREIVQKKLGWDLTDFGSNHFLNTGLLLFTIRNGELNTSRDYAEKIMIARENQITPWHFHWTKAEDIINRAGGRLVIELYQASLNDTLKPSDPFHPGAFDKKSPITYFHDGMEETVDPGTRVLLRAGESITLPPRLYHKFYAETGRGWVMIGEVSRVNDDQGDNRFYEAIPRFAPIEEDVPPRWILCNEYDKILQFKRK
jgi:D-lyxose ketol-isomerase